VADHKIGDDELVGHIVAMVEEKAAEIEAEEASDLPPALSHAL